ncbi:unnamed protein product [Anisakis simplex]|uniref:Transposase n=1 Tax=Anisakis simplex TaxID=6269 RepID=A0A0M3JIN2_ANISI|nr:unnamed protein product [Anisakis simplex]
MRLPISSIEYFTVTGDAKLKGVHWGGRYYTLPFETQFEGGHLKSGERFSGVFLSCFDCRGSVVVHLTL